MTAPSTPPFPFREGALLPRARLSPEGGGPDLDPRAAGRTLVVALLHPPPCAACAGWIDDLVRAAPEVARWDGHIVLAVPEGGRGEPYTASPGASSVRLYTDATGVLAAHAPAVLVADAWGEAYLAIPAGSAHEWPDVEEIVATVRYAAMQCPECSVAEAAWQFR